MIGWIGDGKAGAFNYWFQYISNHLLLFFSAVPLSLLFMYFDYRIFYDESRLKSRVKLYIFINSIIYVALHSFFVIEKEEMTKGLFDSASSERAN
ncbi:MAG: hypothetical protein JXO44_09965 [Clostridia bacterium]|nr:hypothetical protein [Clostridia bacterium]